MVSERERGELEPGRPTLASVPQALHGRRLQAQTERVVEEDRSFTAAEAEIGGANLGHVACRAQAGERQRRVGSGRDRELDARRQTAEQERDGRVDRLCVDDVVVVENQDEVPLGSGDVVHERRDHGIGEL